MGNKNIQTIESVQQCMPPTLYQNKESGQLGSRRVMSYYPQFGEKTAKDELSLNKIIKLVALAALVIIASAFIGFMVGNVPGAILGASIAVLSLSAAACTKAIIEKIREKRFLSVLPKEESNSSGVGKYMLAHARLAGTSQEGLLWKKELINSAKTSLELSANFAGGTTFRELLGLIQVKMKQNSGFKTHLLLSVDFLEEEDKKILSGMKKSFQDRFQFLITDRHYRVSPQLHSEENHVKLMIVDGKYFISGGSGIHPRLSSDQYDAKQDSEKPTKTARLLEKAAIDMDIVGESKPLASTLRRQFFNLYRIWEIRTTNKMQKSRYFPFTGNQGTSRKFNSKIGLFKNVRMKCIVSGPEHRGNNPICREYAKRIDKSQNEVRFANLMFTPPRTIRQALETSKTTHPHKKHIAYLGGIGSKNTLGRKTQVLSSRAHYKLLDKVYEYQTDFQMYHKKVATFDDTHLIIGSFNLGEKSAKHDHEIAFVVKDARVTKRCKEVLKEDGSHSTKLRPHLAQNSSHIKNAFSLILSKLTANFI